MLLRCRYLAAGTGLIRMLLIEKDIYLDLSNTVTALVFILVIILSKIRNNRIIPLSCQAAY